MTIGPYAAAADLYLAKGWGEVLPLPPGQKTPPPSGFTGAKNVDVRPSREDIERWKLSNGDGNLALRMPRGVVGIDVDAYDGKAGSASLATAIDAWGELPPTWRVTSRSDEMSGIRFYRVPEGLAWPSIVGPGIEMVHRGHRYAVAWPSIHPDTRGQYVWLREGQNGAQEPPSVQDLPFLPDNWIVGLTGGEEESRTLPAGAPTHVIASSLEDWETDGSPCRQVVTKVAEVDAALNGDAGSRHDRVRDRLLKVIRLGQVGHAGVGWAMDHIGELFVDTIGASRGFNTAEHEWQSILRGGVDLILGDLKPAEPCYGDRCEMGRIPSLDLPVVHAPVLDDLGIAVTSELREQQERSLYADLSWLKTGVEPPGDEPPSLMARTDGPCLVYKGKVNGLYGEPESAKTWVALLAIVQVLGGGGKAAFLDVDHNGAGLLGRRLRDLGGDIDALADPSRFRIASPEDRDDFGTFVKDMKAFAPDLVVIDSLGEVIPLLGGSSKDNDDITRIIRGLCRGIADAGAAVLTIDHVAKGDGSRDSGYAIGGTSKKRMVDGVYLQCLVRAMPVKGQKGEIELRVEKDRTSRVRERSRDAKHAGVFILDSTDVTGALRARIEPPGDRTVAESIPLLVSKWLSQNPGAHRTKAVVAGVQRRDADVTEALRRLVELGHAEQGKDGLAHVWRHVSLYGASPEERAAAGIEFHSRALQKGGN